MKMIRLHGDTVNLTQGYRGNGNFVPLELVHAFSMGMGWENPVVTRS